MGPTASHRTCSATSRSATCSATACHSFTATTGNNAVDVASWNYNTITITPVTAGAVNLSVAVIDKDAEGDLSSIGGGFHTITVDPLPDLWGTVVSPAEPTAGVHLYGPFRPAGGNVVGMVYGDTASGYSNAGPDTITTNLLTLDPFLLPYQSGSL